MSSAGCCRPSDRECPASSVGRAAGGGAMNLTARRMFELVEPIGVIPYSADEPNEAMFELGFTNYWDTYFAGRAAALGLVPAEGVGGGGGGRGGGGRPFLHHPRPGRRPPPHSQGVAHHHARSGHHRSPAG